MAEAQRRRVLDALLGVRRAELQRALDVLARERARLTSLHGAWQRRADALRHELAHLHAAGRGGHAPGEVRTAGALRAEVGYLQRLSDRTGVDRQAAQRARRSYLRQHAAVEAAQRAVARARGRVEAVERHRARLIARYRRGQAEAEAQELEASYAFRSLG